MKKTPIAIAIFLTLGAGCASAQDTTTRWSLGVAAGPASPVGDFHRFTGVFGGVGGANSGGSVELSGALRIWRALSAAIVVEGQENSGTGVDYWLFAPGTDKPVGSSKGNDWKIARVLAGAVYSWPLTKKTGPVLLVRLLGGVQRTISPDYKDELANLLPGPLHTGPAPSITSPGLTFPWSFAYEADAGLQWRFHSRFSAVGYAGFEGSKPSINLAYVNTYSSATNTYTLDYRRSSYATSAISLRAGVLYALSR